jgi:signal transduction histidine kinase
LRGGNEPALAESCTDSAPAEEQAIPSQPADASEADAKQRVGAATSMLADGVEAHAAPPSTAVAQTPDTGKRQALVDFESVLLDRVPVGVLVYRHDTLLYANRHFLELSGYPGIASLAEAGGLNALFAGPSGGAPANNNGAQSLSIMTLAGDRRPVEGRLFTVPWNGGGSALALVLTNGESEDRGPGALSPATAQNEIRELTARLESFKQAEEELRAASREAQKAAAAKADFLGKVSHEIRTPLNVITGFAEVIMAERFGPIGNERYREYLKDIHSAGMHLVSLLNDLLDLSKIETGQLDLTFAHVSLNELTQQCVGIMQPQASRARIIIRTSLTPGLPQVVADERSLRQIVLNLLSNSIKFTGPGGQVIVSTAFADSGEAVLRVRDTGVGMSKTDVDAALEPFRQTAVAGSWGSGGTGLGLPLTKALAEANRAHFSIKSAPNAGTLVEVAFPPTRVVGQ